MPNDITDPTFRARLAVQAQDLTIAFTATRQSPLDHQRRRIRWTLEVLGAARHFVTGACIGGDRFIGQTLADLYPTRKHTVIVPADQSRVARWWLPYGDRIEVIYMPDGTSYRDRNVALIDGYGSFLGSDLLLGFPQSSEVSRSSARSGSWQTIRLARHSHRHQPVVQTLEGM